MSGLGRVAQSRPTPCPCPRSGRGGLRQKRPRASRPRRRPARRRYCVRSSVRTPSLGASQTKETHKRPPTTCVPPPTAECTVIAAGNTSATSPGRHIHLRYAVLPTRKRVRRAVATDSKHDRLLPKGAGRRPARCHAALCGERAPPRRADAPSVSRLARGRTRTGGWSGGFPGPDVDGDKEDVDARCFLNPDALKWSLSVRGSMKSASLEELQVTSSDAPEATRDSRRARAGRGKRCDDGDPTRPDAATTGAFATVPPRSVLEASSRLPSLTAASHSLATVRGETRRWDRRRRLPPRCLFAILEVRPWPSL
ncbi:hypothetical protein OH77DRAFT_1429115 [Trametes cingulata]|nr:hypothetical protein OH77DRAFT_1429115 [Trametes cingulata]